jgi:hypothetical protein
VGILEAVKDSTDPILDSIIEAENAELLDPDSDLSLLLAAGPERGLRLSATSGLFRNVAEMREEPGLEPEATSETSDA